VNLPVEVIEAVKNDRCVIFVGNRATLEAAQEAEAGYPEQKDLARALGWKKPAVAAGKQKGVVPSVEEGAEAFQAAKGRDALVAYLGDAVGAEAVKPLAAHRAIVKRFPLIFTTNYDDVLERAAATEGLALDVLGRSSPIPGRVPGRVTLVRLRGALSRPDTMVVTRADAARLPIAADTKKQLRTLLRQQVVLFVGYRPDEEEFERLFAELSEAYGGELPRCHLAVAQGAIDDYQWQKWVWRGLLMFTADPSEVMTELEASLR